MRADRDESLIKSDFESKNESTLLLYVSYVKVVGSSDMFPCKIMSLSHKAIRKVVVR